jgi:AraC family transcriptional activator of pobA
MVLTNSDVANYNLFGETLDLPDVVHCEAIFDRASLHSWELAPHRHARLHQVILVRSGGGLARLDDRREVLVPNILANVPAGAIHAFSFEPGTQGWVVTLASEFLDENLSAQEGLRQHLSVAFVADSDEMIALLMDQIFREFAQRRFARAQVLRSFCGALLGAAARAGAEKTQANSVREFSPLAKKFEDLREEHFRKHWKVLDYAKALGVSPTHLSRALRAATGLSAAHLIQQRLIQEARRNLVFTNLPISTISYTLGFEDPAYFSRVFAAATGVSPRLFRARLSGDDSA